MVQRKFDVSVGSICVQRITTVHEIDHGCVHIRMIIFISVSFVDSCISALARLIATSSLGPGVHNVGG